MYKEDGKSIKLESEGWFLVMIQLKDGPSDCETVVLEFTLMEKSTVILLKPEPSLNAFHFSTSLRSRNARCMVLQVWKHFFYSI